MSVNKIYRGTYWTDNGDITSVPPDRETEAEAMADIEAAEAAAAIEGYDSFMATIEVFYVGSEGTST